MYVFGSPNIADNLLEIPHYIRLSRYNCYPLDARENAYG